MSSHFTYIICRVVNGLNTLLHSISANRNEKLCMRRLRVIYSDNYEYYF